MTQKKNRVFTRFFLFFCVRTILCVKILSLRGRTPYFFRVNFETAYFFPYEFDTPYFTQKLGLSAFLISEIVTIFAIFGSVTFQKIEILKKIWSNFEIDLRPLKFSSKNLRPLIFLPENLRLSTP